MDSVLTARFDRADPVDVGAGAPEWVHLLTPGRMEARDGRVFVLDDPAGVVAAFRADAIDLPVDYEHQIGKEAAGQTGPVPAAGWIKDLEVRDNGLWGRVAWTARARELISAKEYRYLSPVLLYHQKDRRVMRLKGAGLVHNPALHLTALASREETMTDPATIVSRIAELLDMPADIAPDELLAALEAALANARQAAASPDPRQFAPVAAMAELLSDRNARTAAMNAREAELKVVHALDKGYITPALRDWATDLCRQDPDSFDAFLASATPAWAHLKVEHRHLAAYRGEDTAAPVSDEAAAICAQLGLPPGSLRD